MSLIRTRAVPSAPIRRSDYVTRDTGQGQYWFAPFKTAELKRRLRELDCSRFKEAATGGDQEQSFEQAFSSLAYSFIKDKAPRLLDYIVGFQLVDRNEDNTKAIGVFGFKVGEQWLYAPTFFLNGDLKGHQLLYVKNQDQFVPLKENWVNYLISRKPHVLGQASQKDTWQLGGIPADIYRLTHPPTSSKYGSDAYRPDMQEWAWPFASLAGAIALVNPGTGAGMDKLFYKHASLTNDLDLGDFLRNTGIETAAIAFDLYRRYPLLKAGFDKFYGTDFFAKLGQTLRSDAQSLVKRSCYPGCGKKMKKRRRRKSASLIQTEEKDLDPQAGLDVFVFRDGQPLLLKDAIFEGASKNKVDEDAPSGITRNVPDLDEKDREKLLRDGILIKDERDPHAYSEVYDTQVKLELLNPGETGLYDVLEKPGSFDRMLIVQHPHTNKNREEFATVVRLDAPRNWLNIHSARLWAKANGDPERPDFNAWFKKQESTKLAKGGYYLAIGPNGAGTTPFEVREDYGNGSYRVNFEHHARFGNDRPTWMQHESDYDRSDQMGPYISTYNAKLFINNKVEVGRLHSTGGELSVPQNFKFLKLKDPPPPPKNKSNSLIGNPVSGEEEIGSAEKPIQPGNILDVQALLYEKTASIRLLDQGSEVWLKSSIRPEERMHKTAALISLMRDHGVTEATAREMLKTAALNGQAVYRIKYAEPTYNSRLAHGPGAPAPPPPLQGYERTGPTSWPAIYPQEEFNPVHELAADRTDPTIYDPFYLPDQQSLQTAQEASESGQKQIFDTSMMAGLLKTVRQSGLVDRYLPSLINALDKVGRLIMMFLWHNEEFEERYGSDDLPELEDGLNNVFDSLGDLTLYLREREVGGNMELESMSGHAEGEAEPGITETARN